MTSEITAKSSDTILAQWQSGESVEYQFVGAAGRGYGDDHIRGQPRQG